MKQVLNGKKYDTDTAEAIADNEFRDGSNRMNCGRCATLYRTMKGNFFVHHETCWQGERDSIEPLSIGEAKQLFEDLDGDADIYADYFGQPDEA